MDASATCKATIESTNGFLFTTTDGYQPIRTRKSDTDLDIKGSGSISFAFSLGANVKFLDETLKAEAGAQVGVEVTGEVKPGDIVVTQDYGLASMCLAKCARVLNQNGLEYTADNMDALMLRRYENKKLLRAGKHPKGSPKRTKEQDVRFADTLEKILNCNH